MNINIKPQTCVIILITENLNFEISQNCHFATHKIVFPHLTYAVLHVTSDCALKLSVVYNCRCDF